MVALLIVGSAISLLSCDDRKVTTSKVSLETLMSEMSDSLTVVVTENGRPSYRFTSPLVEGYSLAREPYREFRKGIQIITYLDDSLRTVDATLHSNYAIHYPNLQLWEAKGDVVVVKHDGKELYTQQLFWNSTTKKIYSNVDTQILDTATGDTYRGEGFESDEEMKEWSFRKMKGSVRVDVSPTQTDSTAVAESPEQEIEESEANEAKETKSEEKVEAKESVSSQKSPAAAASRKTSITPRRQPFRQSAEPEGLDSGVVRSREVQPMALRDSLMERAR
ncbi:MAG: LPS export ABC transporter periplasmic protein LptC [Rikenellaceae bacterium]